MTTNITMIRFIFTTFILVILNTTSGAVKFEDDIKNLALPDKDDNPNVEYIDDFDDVDERILTGTRNSRKKKNYPVSSGNDNAVKNNVKEYFGGVNEKHSVHENGLDNVGVSNGYPNSGEATNPFGNVAANGFKENEGVINGYMGGNSHPNGATRNGFNGNRAGTNGFQGSSDSYGSPSDEETVADVDASNVIEQCIRDDSIGILPCISQKTVSFLERYSHNAKDINIEDNLILSSNPDDNFKSSRLIPAGEDPMDFRTGLEAMSTFLQRRTIRYHLQAIYPGLFIVVNPSYQGKGVIEFQLDNRNMLDERQLSTGRLLIKRNVLPHLLGLKISLISIIPIIFAIIFIITKKAMILSKLALLVTSFVGFSSIAKVLSHGIKASHHHQSHVGGFHNSGGAGYQGHAYEDSILGGGSLFGIATPVVASNDYGYRKPGSDGTYNPEPELIIHTPGFKKDADTARSGKRVAWKRT